MALSIETERLLLREYEDGDAQDILDFSSDAGFWLSRNLGWHSSEEGVREYWEQKRNFDPNADSGWLELVLELKSEHQFVGSIGVGPIRNGKHRQGIVGWLLGRRNQRRGIATEAAKAFITFCFDTMRLHRVYARTGSDNTRSWLLMERIGMRREAHLRKSHLVENEWRDEFIYAVLADEWQAIRAPL